MVNFGGEGHRPFYIGDEIKKYLKLLRKREYIEFLAKEKENIFFSLYNVYLKYKIHKLGVKLGFGIPINAVGPGLRIDHWGFIAINGKAKVGSNCHIFGDVTIGVKDNSETDAPKIGDNVTIGAGARIIGSITIASNCKIGANAVVTHSVYEEGKIIVGVPAKALK